MMTGDQIRCRLGQQHAEPVGVFDRGGLLEGLQQHTEAESGEGPRGAMPAAAVPTKASPRNAPIRLRVGLYEFAVFPPQHTTYFQGLYLTTYCIPHTPERGFHLEAATLGEILNIPIFGGFSSEVMLNVMPILPRGSANKTLVSSRVGVYECVVYIYICEVQT